MATTHPSRIFLQNLKESKKHFLPGFIPYWMSLDKLEEYKKKIPQSGTIFDFEVQDKETTEAVHYDVVSMVKQIEAFLSCINFRSQQSSSQNYNFLTRGAGYMPNREKEPTATT